MNGATSRCRGLWALIGLVLVLGGCSGSSGGPTGPEASGSATSAPSPSPSATSAAPVPSPSSPTPSATPTPTPTPTSPGTLQPSAVPEIDGAARYRSVLRIEEPDWGPGRVDLAFQWLRDGTAIANATGTSYRAAARDIGHRLTVRITGTRTGFSRLRQETAPVGPILPMRLQPSTPQVSGSARVGRTLTGRVDPWGPGAVALTWQWFRGEAKISGATRDTYRLVPEDAGHTIRARVRGSAANAEPALRFSEPTGVVAPGLLDPTPVPAYSGIAQVGEVVTALPRDWGPGEVSLSYQWYRSGKGGDVKLQGATKQRYRFVAADEGHRVKVRVSGSKVGFETVRQYSAWTSEVTPGDLEPGTPRITGKPLSGLVLTAEPGEWRPEGVGFDYRWYRSGMLITRVTGAEYTLSGADVGFVITVRVTGSKVGYREASVESAPTEPVGARER